MIDSLGKAIIEGGRRSVDFLAFFAIGIIGAGMLVLKVDFLTVIGFSAILPIIWIGMRYGLLHLQSKERLNHMREGAKVESEKLLAEHATPGEMKLLSGQRTTEGQNDERG